MRTRYSFTFLLACTLLLAGCATTGKLMKLNLGMSKASVTDAIGDPDAARGSMRNKWDQVVDVWEYGLVKPGDEFPQHKTQYWMYFYDGKLVQWGEAGDWRREADRIYEMRFH